MHENSIDTFERIKESGVLTARRLEAFECVFNHGPISAREVIERLGWTLDNKGRITELHQMDAIEAKGIQESPTGNPETTYIATGRMPVPLSPKAAKPILAAKILATMQKLAKHLTEPQKAELRKAYAIVKDIK